MKRERGHRTRTRRQRAITLRRSTPRPMLIAIVGGSGSGKTWLADKLQAALAPNAARFSLDDFYLDRSHLPPARRAALNFDHPRAIDWAAFEGALQRLRTGQPTRVPSYDFATHCRRRTLKLVKPKSIVLIDGLWLLRRPALRALFSLSVFLDSPARIRLRRRFQRDVLSRGRTRSSIRNQFLATVEPMHRKFVLPQKHRASLVLKKECGAGLIRQLVSRIAILQC